MTGALDLTEPRHLLAKLLHETAALASSPRNSYVAINALRDAYHLREWIWHGRLQNDPALQIAIIGAQGSERDWNIYTKAAFTDFHLIHELCNGSKHFEPKSSDKVKATLTAGYASPLFAYGVGPLGYDVDGLFVVLDGGGIKSVTHLLESVRTFWTDLFTRFPELG
jgi:hypothetical protein